MRKFSNQSGKAMLVMVAMMTILCLGAMFVLGGPAEPPYSPNTTKEQNLQLNRGTGTPTIVYEHVEPGPYLDALLLGMLAGSVPSTPTPSYTPTITYTRTPTLAAGTATPSSHTPTYTPTAAYTATQSYTPNLLQSIATSVAKYATPDQTKVAGKAEQQTLNGYVAGTMSTGTPTPGFGSQALLNGDNNTFNTWANVEPDGTAVPRVPGVAIVDPRSNTVVANVVQIAGTNAGSNVTLGGNNIPPSGFFVYNVPMGINSAGTTIFQLSTWGASSTDALPTGSQGNQAVNSIPRIYNNSNSFSRWREVDAVPNTSTGQGIAAVGIYGTDATAVTWLPPVVANNSSDVGSSNSAMFTHSYGKLLNGSNSYSRWREVDAVSNTATALGGALVGPGYFIYGPITITGTGQSTPLTLTAATGHMPFSTWSCQCKETGDLTDYSTRLEGSVDLSNYDTTTGLVSAVSNNAADGQIFFGTDKYVRSIRLNTTTYTAGGGTNLICNVLGKSF